MIPKVIVQTSRHGIPPYVIKMIQDLSPGWEYVHFTDHDIIQFFIDHPLEEFPEVIPKFYSYNYGEHRADLFRYYYLYVKGGVYIDSDAMIEDHIENIVRDYEFFSVDSTYLPNSIFQGFIGCAPRNIILYQALKDIYSITNEKLIGDFHILCKNLHRFVNEHKHECTIKLYLEQPKQNNCYSIIDTEDNRVVLIHHSETKRIPERT